MYFLNKEKFIFLKKIELNFFSNFFFLKKKKLKFLKKIKLKKKKFFSLTFNNFWKRVINCKKTIYFLLLINYFFNYKNTCFIENNKLNLQNKNKINKSLGKNGFFFYNINFKFLLNFKKKKKKIYLNRAPYKNKIAHNKFNFFSNKFKIIINFELNNLYNYNFLYNKDKFLKKKNYNLFFHKNLKSNFYKKNHFFFVNNFKNFLVVKEKIIKNNKHDLKKNIFFLENNNKFILNNFLIKNKSDINFKLNFNSSLGSTNKFFFKNLLLFLKNKNKNNNLSIYTKPYLNNFSYKEFLLKNNFNLKKKKFFFFFLKKFFFFNSNVIFLNNINFFFKNFFF